MRRRKEPDWRARIGLTPKERLQWALSVAQKKPSEMTNGDWENLRLEFSLFAGNAPAIPTSFTEADRKKLQKEESLLFTEDTGKPSLTETRRIHRDFRRLISSAVERQPLRFSIGRQSGADEVVWYERRGRFIARRPEPTGWVPRAHQTLKEFILDRGHLIKKCPAPTSTALGEGAPIYACGKWFVADRQDQKYCSPKCRTRATVRATRQRQKGARK